MDPQDEDFILQTLDSALNLLRSPNHISPTDVLDMLASTLNCEVATYWIIEDQDQCLRESASWFISSLASERMRADTGKRVFRLGEGMPGRVWKFGRPYLSTDLQIDMSLPRSIDAHYDGLNYGFWLPVTIDHSVVGVVELLSGHSIADQDMSRRLIRSFV